MSDNEEKISSQSRRIVKALITVKCGRDVYDALRQAPNENLKDMRDMIDFILEKRVNQ